MEKKMKKLVLSQETLRTLTPHEVESIPGAGRPTLTCTGCPNSQTCGTSCIGTCPPPAF
jgi:hypothetical protein